MKIDPTALLEDMCKTASSRKAESLRLLFKLCQAQAANGSSDYSIATIGRLSAEQDGPSAAAIRNKPGEDYRALLKAFAESVGGNVRKKSLPERTVADELLEGVVDPVLKVRVKLLLAENESLRAQLLAARHLANQTSAINLGASDSALPSPTEAKGLKLTLQEVAALEDAISADKLKHWGWTIDQIGRVSSEAGQVIFRAGFVSAVQKTVRHVADF
jgi:hypothetical protein